MINDSSFDPIIHCLGSLCKRGHDWNGTGRSLRSRDGTCKECHRLKESQRRLQRKQNLELEKVTEKYYLGKLCVHGHDHQGTGFSLRFVLRQQCAECQRYKRASKRDEIRQKQYRLKNIEKYRAREREYYLAHRERVNQTGKERYQANPDSMREYKRELYQRTKSAYLARQKRYNLKHREHYLARMKAANGRRKALKKSVIAGDFSASEIKSVFLKFGGSCAYCGSAKNLTLDHFIALASGGTHVESNFVSACRSCNSSKGASDPLEWYKRQSFFSWQSWNKLLNLLGKKHSNYNQITLL